MGQEWERRRWYWIATLKMVSFSTLCEYPIQKITRQHDAILFEFVSGKIFSLTDVWDFYEYWHPDALPKEIDTLRGAKILEVKQLAVEDRVQPFFGSTVKFEFTLEHSSLFLSWTSGVTRAEGRFHLIDVTDDNQMNGKPRV